MLKYFAFSCSLHALGFLLLLLFLAPAAKQVSATYTIDFIGSEKVIATTGQEAAAKAAPKTAVAAPAPAKEAIPQPETKQPAKKAYAAKAEITEKPKTQTKKKVTVEEPLAAPSILDEEPAPETAKDSSASSSATQSGNGSGQEGEFAGGNIQTDFANFPYPWYITQVRNSLWSEWEKRRPAGEVLSAMVSFAIARDGKIKNLKVERSSGDDTFDFAASSAVINAGPFAPLPMYYEKDELTVTVEFKQEK